MQPCDPREWSIRHPWTVVVVFIMLSMVFAWGNLRVQKGGILDRDVILREDDPFQLMDRYVQDKVQEGFEGREFIPLVINASISSEENAEKILQVTRAAQAAFGETVLSLATAPAYHDTGEALLDEPYVTKGALSATNFHGEDWRGKVAADPGVFGLLVGRDFSWASVVRYLPPGYNEISRIPPYGCVCGRARNPVVGMAVEEGYYPAGIVAWGQRLDDGPWVNRPGIER